MLDRKERQIGTNIKGLVHDDLRNVSDFRSYLSIPDKISQEIAKQKLFLASQLIDDQLDHSLRYTLYDYKKGYEKNYVWIRDTYSNKTLRLFYDEDEQPQPTGPIDVEENSNYRTSYINFCIRAGFLIPDPKGSGKYIRNEEAIKPFLKPQVAEK